eukprot:ANDGO_08641.mRNA.1 Intraflagellar transport protein 22
MASRDALKILVVGPRSSGKTAISNFVSGHQPTLDPEYRPTTGVRCLEFERDRLAVTDSKKKTTTNVRCAVELWDCSGDLRFQSCWPALSQGCDGVLLVFNPDDKGQEKDVETYFRYFVQGPDLRLESQTALFAHRQAPPAQRVQKIKISKALVKVPIAQTSVDYDVDTLTIEFDKFLASCYAVKREKDETAILS